MMTRVGRIQQPVSWEADTDFALDVLCAMACERPEFSAVHWSAGSASSMWADASACVRAEAVFRLVRLQTQLYSTDLGQEESFSDDRETSTSEADSFSAGFDRMTREAIEYQRMLSPLDAARVGDRPSYAEYATRIEQLAAAYDRERHYVSDEVLEALHDSALLEAIEELERLP